MNEGEAFVYIFFAPFIALLGWIDIYYTIKNWTLKRDITLPDKYPYGMRRIYHNYLIKSHTHPKLFWSITIIKIVGNLLLTGISIFLILLVTLD